MATFIEQTNYEKIAKALIASHGKLWVVVCGEFKETIKHHILIEVQALGIESESQLYRDIDYSICTRESIMYRDIHWSHDVLICNVDGLISETIKAACVMTCIKIIQR